MTDTTTWQYDDGGRAAAGFRGDTGDCVTRAIAIATGMPYREVYNELQARQAAWIATSRSAKARRDRGRTTRRSIRTGVYAEVYKPWLAELGWVWTPTMAIGSGTTVHLAGAELPAGRIIARCSKHLAAVIDGVVHDTYDSTRDGRRAVYGYFRAA